MSVQREPDDWPVLAYKTVSAWASGRTPSVEIYAAGREKLHAVSLLLESTLPAPEPLAQVSLSKGACFDKLSTLV